MIQGARTGKNQGRGYAITVLNVKGPRRMLGLRQRGGVSRGCGKKYSRQCGYRQRERFFKQEPFQGPRLKVAANLQRRTQRG